MFKIQPKGNPVYPQHFLFFVTFVDHVIQLHKWQAAITWSFGIGLGAASSHLCKALPNRYIWPVGPNRCNMGKSGLKSIWFSPSFPIGVVQAMVLWVFGWLEWSDWEQSSMEAAVHCQDGCLCVWSAGEGGGHLQLEIISDTSSHICIWGVLVVNAKFLL